MVASSSTGASEKPKSAKDDQRHKHNRSEYGGEKQHEQDPEQSEDPEQPENATSSTEASPAEAPHPDQQEPVRQGAREQRDRVQSPLKVPRRDRVDVGQKAWCSLRRAAL
jgi:hypothetical protein